MSKTGEYTKPLPRRDGLNGEFYAHCRNHELRFMRCTDCGVWRHMPRESCAACGSTEYEWARSSGRGTLFTFTVSHRAFHPGFEADVPYAVSVVEMEEGVRMVSRVVGIAADAHEIGMPLEVVFEDVTDDLTLPMFRCRTA